jgi:hypothetical protein
MTPSLQAVPAATRSVALSKPANCAALTRSVGNIRQCTSPTPGRLSKSLFWRLDRPAGGSIHKFKYRLALVADLVCVLRYDNEAGKGDHRHIGRTENSYQFADPETLLTAAWSNSG